MSTPAQWAQPRTLLVSMHVPFIAFTAAQAVTGFGLDTAGNQWIALLLVLAAGGIQIHHSLAAAGGVRPRHWPWTLALLVVITYAATVPSDGHGALRWPTFHWFLIASFGMLLPGRLAPIVAVVDALGVASWLALATAVLGYRVDQVAWQFVYMTAILLGGGGGLWAAARLVLHAEELRAMRAELAELAIDNERLRISRDLHDLLGQSLSAIALKGDLVDRLLSHRDIPRASTEIESLVSVARSALHDLRNVAHREGASLAIEIDRGIEILESIGIETQVAVAVENFPPRVDELFAWAVREGVTNVVRHSSATRCSIAIHRLGGELTLEIRNDGAGLPSAHGHGLNGLAARAAALSGQARGQMAGGGWFVLTVDAPGEAA